MDKEKEEFIRSIKSLVSFWLYETRTKNTKEKLDGLAFSILNQFDQIDENEFKKLDYLHELYYEVK